ncbi:MAG: hypothetical protein DDT22_01186 [candidate division WS2 bacterium]|nr:hypothetical protein [Candidatus Lithacetigena glycinireducens]
MSKYYTLKEVKAIRDEINRLGERSFPLLNAEWDKARAKWDKAVAKWNKVGVEWDKARAEWNKALVEWDKARAEWDKAVKEYDIKLFDILISICPEARYHWEGYLAIPKDDNEDWIIPVFTGNYKDIKHQAFSVWTMPRGRWYEELAREVKDE